MSSDLQISTVRLSALNTGRLAIKTSDVLFRVEGPGAVQCIQGILTNDVAKGQLPFLRFAAILTAKGMIISPLWVVRDESGFWLLVPRNGADRIRELLGKTMPPRLAKVTECGPEAEAWWLIGSDPPVFGNTIEVFTVSGPAPFTSIAIGVTGGISEALAQADWQQSDEKLRSMTELLCGWPTLGSEIDDKTLPQEVRFDELDAIKYDKGCYVGQETVSRLHFRGHANRTMLALLGRGKPPEERAIQYSGKQVGSIATLASLEDGWLASAKIRTSVNIGDWVQVGEVEAKVTDFPVDIDSLTS